MRGRRRVATPDMAFAAAHLGNRLALEALLAGGLELSSVQRRALEGCMSMGLPAGPPAGQGMVLTCPHCKDATASLAGVLAREVEQDHVHSLQLP